jgi:hypothetical protein
LADIFIKQSQSREYYYYYIKFKIILLRCDNMFKAMNAALPQAQRREVPSYPPPE